jgi:hypothetical protein
MKNNTIWVSNITKDTKLSFMNNLQSNGIYFLLISIKSLFGILPINRIYTSRDLLYVFKSKL